MPIGKVWVFAEADEGKASSASLELLTKARELGDTVEAVLIDSSPDAIVPELGEHGAATVYVADPGTSLTGVVGGAALAKLVEEQKPDLVLFDQSYDGRDALARLSAKLDLP